MDLEVLEPPREDLATAVMVKRGLTGLGLEPPVGERRDISMVLDSVGAISIPLGVDLVVRGLVVVLDEPHRVDGTRSVPTGVGSW